jgi:cysteine sulfinate desulfinase/cysteine desulfurase-like protein
MDAERDRLLKLRKRLEQKVTSALDVTQVNGHAERRLPT